MNLVDVKYFATIANKDGETVSNVELKNFNPEMINKENIWAAYYDTTNVCSYINIESKASNMFDCGLYRIVSVKKMNIWEEETTIY